MNVNKTKDLSEQLDECVEAMISKDHKSIYVLEYPAGGKKCTLTFNGYDAESGCLVLDGQEVFELELAKLFRESKLLKMNISEED